MQIALGPLGIARKRRAPEAARCCPEVRTHPSFVLCVCQSVLSTLIIIWDIITPSVVSSGTGQTLKGIFPDVVICVVTYSCSFA